MNPLFLVGGAAALFFIYEAKQNNHAVKPQKTHSHLPLASSQFSDMKENPFQQKEKITVSKVMPSQRGQLENPALAGRWMLTLPTGCMFPWVGSFNTLKRKVIVEIPGLKKPPKGFVAVGNSHFQLETLDAFKQ
ncbi:MAG: hypothetical protein JSR46_02645 [Verrucomicrobia bacterium]|nr:hypothetical protein [Verrucomicrobiota bacterium]